MKVRLLAEAWTCEGGGVEYTFARDVELPFAPFPGLEIEAHDWAEDGNLPEGLARLLEGAGFEGQDTPDPFVVWRVLWSPQHGRFECRESAGRKCTFSDYRRDCATLRDLESEVRFLGLFGFRVTERWESTPEDAEGGGDHG